MNRLLRLAAGAGFALALGAPVSADAPAPEPSASPAASAAPSATPYLQPTAVVVRIEGGFHPANRWLWYDRDGTARFEGILDAGRGRFRSHVDYATVERVLADAGMCTRHSTLVRPVGMDMFYYRVSVRCGRAWRLFSSADVNEPAGEAQVRHAVRELEHIAANLSWERTNDDVGPPDFHGPYGPAMPAPTR